MREKILLAPLQDTTIIELTLDESIKNLANKYLSYLITDSVKRSIQSELNYFSDKYAENLVFDGQQYMLYADFEDLRNHIEIFPIKLLENNKQFSIFEYQSKIKWI